MVNLRHAVAVVSLAVLPFATMANNPVSGNDKKQEGYATYYGKGAHGRRTASGERHHMDSMICAHRTLPFGTRIRVTDKSSGKSVVVKVNDRGPFGKGRVVDLSYGAAKKLGILSKGVAKVTLNVES